jgi:hypothetical protein
VYGYSGRDRERERERDRERERERWSITYLRDVLVIVVAVDRGDYEGDDSTGEVLHGRHYAKRQAR